MKQFITENSEKENILSMHKALMKEQVKATGELDENERILRKAMTAGCLKKRFIKTSKIHR